MKILNLVKNDSNKSGGVATAIDEKLLRQVATTDCKRLINQISNLQSECDFRSLCVTSPRAGEGKTLTSNMLAIGYVQQLNKRVLLINASLQPTRDTIFVERIIGSNSNADGNELARPVLDLISTAASDFDEASTKSTDFLLGDYIKEVSNSYDLIVVDSNPITDIEPMQIDPVVLASYCDATIVVCTKQSFDKEVLEQMKATFHSQNLTHKIIGLLHNSGVSL